MAERASTARRYALLAGLVFSACGGSEAGDLARSTTAGAPSAPAAVAPTVELAQLPGIEAALAARRGEAVLVNFWATWCPPCVAELPDLAKVHQRHAGRDGSVLAVSFDILIPDAGTPADVRERVNAYASARKMPFPVLVYDARDYDAINEHFDLPGQIPVTIAFDREGREVGRIEAEANEAEFEELMQRALASR